MAAVRPDDWKVGIFVAITSVVKYREEDDASYTEREHFTFQMMPMRRRERRERYDGVPLEVMAVSLPFICVSDGKDRFALDTRDLVFTKLNKDFVAEMREGYRSSGTVMRNGERVSKSRIKQERKEKKRLKEEAKKDPSMCPRCFTKCKQIMEKPGDPWIYVCEQCGLKRPLDNGNGSAP